MAQMLRHKETGELFIYTAALATLSELEPVVEDHVAKVIAEIKAEEKADRESAQAPMDEIEAALGNTFAAPDTKKKSRFGK